MDGILNEHSLRSAIARPYGGYFESVFEKAAALVEAIVQNHGFIDGNKRTAVLILGVFVHRTGYTNVATEDALLDQITRVSTGDVSLKELTQWFREVLRSK